MQLPGLVCTCPFRVCRAADSAAARRGCLLADHERPAEPGSAPGQWPSLPQASQLHPTRTGVAGCPASPQRCVCAQPKEGQVEDLERAKQAAKLMSRSSKFSLSSMPAVDLKAWEIKRSDIHIELKPDGSQWLLGAGAYGKVCPACIRRCSLQAGPSAGA